MRLVVAGRARDVRGFAVAGVETIPCETAAEAQALLDGLAADIGLLIVPRWFEQATAARLARLRERKGPPVIVALPSGPRDDPGRR
jgi:vacuolar-type H+-ATPase subunit F/Vma7